MTDIDGAQRHTLNRAQLDDIYRSLDNFRSDCTKAEYRENKVHFDAIFSLIHSHMV